MSPGVSLQPTPDVASGTLSLAASQQGLTTSLEIGALAEEHHTPQNPEETLESHEVIELQAFSERKAWIEEKIKA